MVPYDELSLFHENAEEFGLPYDGPPHVERVFVDVEPDADGPRRLSALVWGDASPELVLLHGGAQNAHTWDTVAMALARPLVAIDLPGFGHSDGRPELIAPDAMGTFLARLIEEWGLGAPHVVGPDVGTAAGLFLAANAPDRVTSLTIGGGAVRDPIDADRKSTRLNSVT